MAARKVTLPSGTVITGEAEVIDKLVGKPKPKPKPKADATDD